MHPLDSQCGKENPTWLWLEQGYLVKVLEVVWVKSLAGTLNLKWIAASWKLQPSSELIDRNLSFNVRRHPCGNRDGVYRTLTGRFPLWHFMVHPRTMEWREEKKMEVGEGSHLFFNSVIAFKPGFTCWKNAFLGGWFWFWRKVFSLDPPTSRSWLLHMFISCLPKAVLEDWTWDLSCNSLFLCLSFSYLETKL